MKKISILLSGLVLGSLCLTSCDYEQDLPPVAYPDGGSEETIGNGSWNHPFAVWQTLTGVQTENDQPAWVTGYIVGSIDANATKMNAESSQFGTYNAAGTNIMLANNPEEDNWENCIPVQLPSGAVRTALNLSSNPGNLGKQVTIQGTTGSKYFGIYGLRSCTAYEWGAQGTYTPDDNSGEGSSMSFLTNSLANCTIEDVTKPSGVNFVWEWSSQYKCAKATGYINNTSYATDSYLVTEEITLGSAPYATVDQALNYLRGGVLRQNIGFYAREGSNGAWKELVFTNEPTGDSFTFVNSRIDLSDYAGKTIQIGLRYQSTASSSTTWEVKNLYIFNN